MSLLSSTAVRIIAAVVAALVFVQVALYGMRVHSGSSAAGSAAGGGAVIMSHQERGALASRMDDLERHLVGLENRLTAALQEMPSSFETHIGRLEQLLLDAAGDSGAKDQASDPSSLKAHVDEHAVTASKSKQMVCPLSCFHKETKAFQKPSCTRRENSRACE